MGEDEKSMTPAQQKLGQAVATKLETQFSVLAFEYLAKILCCGVDEAKERFRTASEDDLERWTLLVTSGRSVPKRR